ncbi:MAG TPA: hypothetical protein VGN23_08445 [Verrucomicrobiae bacterium]|jgi:hypothetical protein
MSYYEQLIRNMGKAMRKHPRSVVAMNSESFKVVATGKNSKELNRRLNKVKKTDGEGISVIFQKPGANTVWIL